jgi:hypothetical protein
MTMGIFIHSGFGIWLLDFLVADVASPRTERLKDPNYVQGLHKLFGMNQPSLTEPRKSFCGEPSEHWNSEYPYHFSNDTIRVLQERNEYDNMLYRQLNYCPNGVIFPDQ